MSPGKPVISAYHAVIPEAITDGAHGLLIIERFNEKLKEVLVKLIPDLSVRMKLGQNARGIALKYFDQKEMMIRINDVF
jgi:colanic acid/amylovoran biosynthesis glycosyltransferase